MSGLTEQEENGCAGRGSYKAIESRSTMVHYGHGSGISVN